MPWRVTPGPRNSCSRSARICSKPWRLRQDVPPQAKHGPGRSGYNEATMAQTYAAKYLLKAAASAPRDLINAAVATMRPIHPTVLIFHCTFVCDARCEMCSNWTRGDRKSDMSLEEIDRAFRSDLWKNIEIANLSGGEPTTRNDMVEVSRVMLDRLPRLRKFGVNTTGLPPHRAIPT